MVVFQIPLYVCQILWDVFSKTWSDKLTIHGTSDLIKIVHKLMELMEVKPVSFIVQDSAIFWVFL